MLLGKYLKAMLATTPISTPNRGRNARTDGKQDEDLPNTPVPLMTINRMMEEKVGNELIYEETV